MTDEQQQPPELEYTEDGILKCPFGDRATLDLNYGYNDYIAATTDSLNRIVQSGYPGDPRKTANMMIFEIFNYIEGLMPGVDIREAAAMYGASVGIGLGGYIADGVMPESAAEQIAAVFYVAMKSTIPIAIQMKEAMADQEEHGLVAPDGSPVSSKAGGKVMNMPKRHRRKRRKK